MNLDRISKAVREIERNKRALEWLEFYGEHLTGRDGSCFRFVASIGSTGNGADEASRMIEGYAALRLPEIVKTAIQNCRNTIEIERAAIAAESAPA